MPTRWMKDTWPDAVGRVARWSGDVAVAWAEAPDAAGVWKILGATIRGGVSVGDIEYRYEHLRLRSRMQPPIATARNLVEGRLLKGAGDREFREVRNDEGQAHWLTSGTPYGMTGPVNTPSYYFSVAIADTYLSSQAQLSLPAFGAGQPYYPTGEDALLEVLYGVTRDQDRRDIFNQIVIHLPYVDAYIEKGTFIDTVGMVLTISEGRTGSATGHEVQTLSKLDPSARTYQRDYRTVDAVGDMVFSFPFDLEPSYFAAALQDQNGLLVDYLERNRRPAEGSGVGAPLAPEALPEAFDFLGSVWRNVTGFNLFEGRSISPAAELRAPVTTREDFSSRMSALSDVMRAIAVDPSLYQAKDAEGMREDATLGRMKLAVQRLLVPPEVDSALASIAVLQAILRVRAALQHPQAQPDVPASLARLGIPYPIEWPLAWDGVRNRAVDALRELRRSLETLLT